MRSAIILLPLLMMSFLQCAEQKSETATPQFLILKAEHRTSPKKGQLGLEPIKVTAYCKFSSADPLPADIAFCRATERFQFAHFRVRTVQEKCTLAEKEKEDADDFEVSGVIETIPLSTDEGIISGYHALRQEFETQAPHHQVPLDGELKNLLLNAVAGIKHPEQQTAAIGSLNQLHERVFVVRDPASS